MKNISITAVSDLHGFWPELEGGDLLIVAGDLTATDHPIEYLDFFRWFDNQKYKHRILVSGNHDNLFQEIPPTYGAWHYLCDSGVEIEGLKIWGSPWTRTFDGMNPCCKAFTCETEEELDVKFSLIPEDTDILITHSPPWTIFDKTISGKQVGSWGLLANLINRVKPKLHVFGHLHESYGQQKYWNRTIFVNASHVNEKYQPVNKPIRIIL